MDEINPAAAVIEFGRFRLLPEQRILSAEGRHVELGGRAIDVLMALVTEAGEVLDHDRLRHLAWPGQVIEENNLQVQISALRKALGADRHLIRTVVGRGYQFTGAVSTGLERHDGAGPAHNLAAPMSELIGRETALEEAATLLMSGRLTTLAGAGGIGKSRLGLALARRLLPQFVDGVWWVDVGSVTAPELLGDAVAAALGVCTGAAATNVAAVILASALERRQMLLVLDGCEHLVAAATTLAETLLRGCVGVRLLVTSREPLCSDGETVYRLGSLQPASRQSAADCPATRLFVTHARRDDPHFAAGPAELERIMAICRRLDGNPLAIKLAAARAPVLGLDLLVSGLDEPLELLVGGHRTALARQRSLRASLDWSHALLSQRERVVLRRLSIFANAFTLEAATVLLAGHGMSVGELVDSIAGLVAKSLLLIDCGTTARRYRLTVGIRAYALARLRERGEQPALARRHAQYHATLLAGATTRSGQLAPCPAEDRLLADEVKLALDWAFGNGAKDQALGVALAAEAAPLWWRLSRPDEAQLQARRALACAGACIDPACAMPLQASLAAALSYGPAAGRPEAEGLWREVQRSAEACGDAAYQLRALAGLWTVRLEQGDLGAALFFAESYGELARETNRSADAAYGERLCGHVLHLMGRQDAARLRLEHMLARLSAQAGPGFDQFMETRTAAQADLSMVLWLQGYPDQALRLARANVAQAYAGGRALALCHTLAVSACPIALLTGQLEALEGYVQLLIDTAGDHGLEGARACGHFYRGLLAVRRGADAAGLPAALIQLRTHGDAMLYTLALVWFALVMEENDEVAEASTAVDRALVRAGACGECWGSGEMLRLKAELLLRQGLLEADAADTHFRHALALARRQGAAAIELRCANSLGRLWHHRAAGPERMGASATLIEVCARFGGGEAPPDLVEARALLTALD